jgi:hypothetical protein
LPCRWLLVLASKHLAHGLNKAGHELMNLENGLTRHLGETKGFAIAPFKLVSEQRGDSWP